MKCKRCNKEFDEKEMEISHVVPKYMFKNKNDADKHGREWLCKECHRKYEWQVITFTWKKIPLELQNKIKEDIENGRFEC